MEVKEESVRIKKYKRKWEIAGLILSLVLIIFNFAAIMLTKFLVQTAVVVCVNGGLNMLISTVKMAELWLIKTANEKVIE